MKGEELMDRLNQRVQKTAVKFSTLSFWLIGVVAVFISAGCSIPTESDPGSKASATAVPAAPTTKPVQPQAATKDQAAAAQTTSLQELSVREESGLTTLMVKFSQPVDQYRHFPVSQPARIIVDILGGLKGSPTSESFRIDTHWAGTVRLSSTEGSIRLAVDIAAATVPPYTVAPENGGLKIVIGAFDPNATLKKDVTLVTGGARADILTTKGASVSRQSSGDEKKFTGQKISLEFKDADIKNVFRLLAEVSGKNIIVTDDVNRKITVRLLEVPWDQAMDLIINTNGLDKEEVGNVIRISTAGRIKSERDTLAAARKAEENLETLQTAYLTVNYARVIKGKDDKEATDKDLVDKIKALLSPRGIIVADQRTNTLIVKDVKKGIEEAQSFLAKLDTRTPQVLIESNLLETTPTFSRALGSEIDFVYNRLIASSRFLADSPFAGSPNTTAPPFPTPTSGLRLGIAGNNINAFITAAENEGNVKIISRPSVVTLNNIESTIESANIIRIRTAAATVGESGSIIQVRAGIILTVTPQVSADGFVLLKINVKSSTLDFGRTVDGIPAEITREAKANVLVRDGETVVIGGILKDSSSTSDSGIPYLKEVPVLGWLFRKSTWQKDFEELVVFITPRIVEAGSANLPSADQLWRGQLSLTQGN